MSVEVEEVGHMSLVIEDRDVWDIEGIVESPEGDLLTSGLLSCSELSYDC